MSVGKGSVQGEWGCSMVTGYWSHSMATSRLLSCHQAEAAKLSVSKDSAHLFCFKAQNFENNHFMSHKTIGSFAH